MVRTIQKPNKMAAILFFTIQNPNFETFGSRMDSVFECLVFEPPLYSGIQMVLTSLLAEPGPNTRLKVCCLDKFFSHFTNTGIKVLYSGTVDVSNHEHVNVSNLTGSAI